MAAPPITRKWTPVILYTRIAEDTPPVFTSASAAARYGLGGGPRVRPGMPEDTSAKSQDQSSQGLTSGMPGKARKSNGRTRHPGGTLALFLNGVSSRGDEQRTRLVRNARESGHGRRPRTLAGVVRHPTAGACPPAGTPPLLSPCPARRMSSSTLAGWRPSLSLRAVTISPCGMVEHTSLKRERRMRRPSLAL